MLRALQIEVRVQILSSSGSCARVECDRSSVDDLVTRIAQAEATRFQGSSHVPCDGAAVIGKRVEYLGVTVIKNAYRDCDGDKALGYEVSLHPIKLVHGIPLSVERRLLQFRNALAGKKEGEKLVNVTEQVAQVWSMSLRRACCGFRHLNQRWT